MMAAEKPTLNPNSRNAVTIGISQSLKFCWGQKIVGILTALKTMVKAANTMMIATVFASKSIGLYLIV